MEQHTPFLSVIVPVFNTEAHVRECLDSLLAQSFGDLEIVIVDDGSTDASSGIVADYAARHDNVTAIRKDNGGLADARNHGIAAALGLYVGFVDADDHVAPDMFGRMCEAARRADADIVVCKMMGFDPESGAEIPYEEAPAGLFGASLKDSPEILVRTSPSACNKIFRRSLFAENGLLFPVGLSFEDLATTFPLFAAANRIVKVDEFLYFYRRSREGSITSVYGAHYEDLSRALEVMYERFSARGAFDGFREQLLEVALVHLLFGRYADFFLHAPFSAKSPYIDEVFRHLDAHFPGWRQSEVLWQLTSKSRWLRAISTSATLLKVYSALPARVGQSLDWRLGMFTGGRG